MKNRESTEKINKTKSWLPEPAVPCFQSLGATAEMDVEGGCPPPETQLGTGSGLKKRPEAASGSSLSRACRPELFRLSSLLPPPGRLYSPSDRSRRSVALNCQVPEATGNCR